MMNLERFKYIRSKNARILKHCLETRTTDLSQITFWEEVRGCELPFDQLCARSYDILGCCAVGAVPSIATSGADGYFYHPKDNSGPWEMETKVSAIESRNIYVGSRGGLYWSSDPTNYNNRAALLSKFQGKFDPNMKEDTWQSKSRYTALVCFDRDANAVIDSWMLSPRRVLHHLNKRSKNASLSIKLNVFMDDGHLVNCTVPTLGWNTWQKQKIVEARAAQRYM